MQQRPSFQDVERFVRDFAGLRSDQTVTSKTRLNADLGITGGDGDDLLEKAAKYFNARLQHPIHGYRETFSLAENEYLFDAEGLDHFGVTAFLRWARNEPQPKVRDVTMSELHGAILRTIVSETPPNKSLERTREG
jgi:hypothetical protein